MKKNKSILAFFAVTLATLSTWASSQALYLSAAQNEDSMVDSMTNKGNGKYKIWIHVDGKLIGREVNRSELAFATNAVIDGHQVGRRALVLNSETNKVEHCQVGDLFENGQMNLFCDLYEDGLVARHNFSGPTQNFIAEINGPVDGLRQRQNARLKTDMQTDMGVLKAGTRVRVRFFFANGKVLVQENPEGIEFMADGPTGNANSFLVLPSDLQ